jgi:hypothetical protein
MGGGTPKKAPVPRDSSRELRPKERNQSNVVSGGQRSEEDSLVGWMADGHTRRNFNRKGPKAGGNDAEDIVGVSFLGNVYA